MSQVFEPETINDELREQCQEFLDDYNGTLFGPHGPTEEGIEALVALCAAIRADGIREAGAMVQEWFDGDGNDVGDVLERIDELAESVEEDA